MHKVTPSRVDLGLARAEFQTLIRDAVPQFTASAQRLFDAVSKAAVTRGVVPPSSVFSATASFDHRFSTTRDTLLRFFGGEGLKIICVAIGVPVVIAALGIKLSALAMVLITVVVLLMFCRDLRRQLQRVVNEAFEPLMADIRGFLS